MIDLQSAELDEMIQAEKKQVAFEYHNEAWADGISDGVSNPRRLEPPTFLISLESSHSA